MVESTEDSDATQFEASESHQHLDPVLESPGCEIDRRLALWTVAVTLAFDGLDLIRETPGATDAGAAIGLGGVGQGATVRWHLDRGLADRWLAEDLAGCRYEAVMEIETRDLQVHDLLAAVLPDPLDDL